MRPTATVSARSRDANQLICFAGACSFRKFITVGENIWNRGSHVRFEGIISNNTDTFLVFSDVTDVTEHQPFMYFGLKRSPFYLNGMEFNVISVDIPKNVTMIQRIG
jgi:hypothetical protein